MPISDIFHDNDYDLVYTGFEHFTLEDKKVGFDGIKQIFEPDLEEGGLSLRAKTLLSGCIVSMIGSGIFKGSYEAKFKWIKFAESNAQAKYKTPHLARNALMTLSYDTLINTGGPYGWRFACSYALLMVPSIFIPAYRGEYTPFDMTLGGLLSGSYWHYPGGVKKMARGGAIGAAAATAAGVCIWGLTTVLGITADDILDSRRANFLRQREFIMNKSANPDQD